MSSFEKATAVWNKCNLSKSAEIIFNICKWNLVTPCITRLNSIFDSLQCLLKFEQCTLKDLCQKLYLPELSKSEVEFLREYCTVLEPIAMAIDKVQGEQFSFYGYAIPVLRQTETSLKTIQNQSLRSCSTCSSCFERNAKNIPIVSSTIFYGGKRWPFSHNITSLF